MVTGISSYNPYQYTSQVSSNSSSLTDEQKTTLEEIIAKYDPANMTEEETKTMMDEIKAAGIRPSKEFGEIMNAAGFKPPERPQGPLPEDSASEIKENLPQYLLDFIEKQESGTVTQDDIDTLIKNLQNSGDVTKGQLVDQKV